MARLLLFLFVYLVLNGATVAATGVGLSPAVALAAVVSAGQGHALLGALGNAGAAASLRGIRTLARLRALRAIDSHAHHAHDAHHTPAPDGGAGPHRRPRAPMRRFARPVTWDVLTDRYNPREFRQAHGLSREAFDHVLSIIKPLIVDAPAGRGGYRGTAPLPAELRFSMVLRWLRGASHHEFLVMYGISISAFYQIVWRVCRAICNTHSLPLMSGIAQMRAGDDSYLRSLARGFARYSQNAISNCIGAIDGVQVWIRKPWKREVPNPSYYFTRHHKFAINAQAIADSMGRIIWLSVRAPGSMHDSLAFGLSELCTSIASLGLGGYHLVGDDAYTDSETMLTPVPGGPAAGSAEDDYNYYQSLTRQSVERAFGMLQRRWGVLWRRLEVRLAHVPLLLLTLVHLHNVCVDFHVPEPEVDDAFVPMAHDPTVGQGRRRDREASVLRSTAVARVREGGLHRPA